MLEIPMAPQNQVPNQTLDLTKITKTLKDTSSSLVSISWFSLVVNIGLFIYSLVSRADNTGLPRTDATGLSIIFSFSFVFIVLGKRLLNPLDTYVKRYLVILISLMVLLLGFVVWSRGRIGLLFFLVLGYLVYSLIKINKCLADESFRSNQVKLEYKINKKGWIAFSVAAIILIAGALAYDLHSIENGTYSGFSKTDLIKSMVESAKTGLKLPSKMDEYTQFVDITPEASSIRYHYVASGIVPEQISGDLIKSKLKPTVCSDAELKKVLNKDINLEYSYKFETDSSKELLVTISKSDCSE